MNPRLKKITGEISKVKEKLADYESRLSELEKQKTEIENSEIIALVREINISVDEFELFIKSYGKGENK